MDGRRERTAVDDTRMLSCHSWKARTALCQDGETVDGKGLGESGDWVLEAGHVAFGGSIRYPSGPVSRTSCR